MHHFCRGCRYSAYRPLDDRFLFHESWLMDFSHDYWSRLRGTADILLYDDPTHILYKEGCLIRITLDSTLKADVSRFLHKCYLKNGLDEHRGFPDQTTQISPQWLMDCFICPTSVRTTAAGRGDSGYSAWSTGTCSTMQARQVWIIIDIKISFNF